MKIKREEYNELQKTITRLQFLNKELVDSHNTILTKAATITTEYGLYTNFYHAFRYVLIKQDSSVDILRALSDFGYVYYCSSCLKFHWVGFHWDGFHTKKD